MKILAFDTSTQTLGIALLIDDQVHIVEEEGGARASETLLKHIGLLLEQFELKLSDLDAIAFGAGPGAFTGLRTACSAAQGMALGADLPAIPVVTLQAGAQQYMMAASKELQSTDEPDILVQLDARMDEWYWAHYQWRDGAWHVLAEPTLSSPEVLQAYIKRTQPMKNITIASAQMTGMIELAKQAWQKGETVKAEYIVPLYLRNKVALTTAERMALHTERDSSKSRDSKQ